MDVKKAFRIISISIALFLVSNMLFVCYGKIQCGRMLEAIWENDINKLESVLKFANPNSVPGIGIIDVMTENIDKRTPLGAACEAGNLEMVELLLAKGADVNYVPRNAYASPLGFAVLSDSVENLEIVKLLLAKDADVNYSRYTTWQPAYKLMNARELRPNEIAILKELMKAGARTENDLILHEACYWKHEEAIRYLIEEWGYDASDPKYLCAYCYGADKYSYDTFVYFLEKGANPYEKDEYMKCAIDHLKEESPEWAEKLMGLAAEYGFEK